MNWVRLIYYVLYYVLYLITFTIVIVIAITNPHNTVLLHWSAGVIAFVIICCVYRLQIDAEKIMSLEKQCRHLREVTLDLENDVVVLEKRINNVK